MEIPNCWSELPLDLMACIFQHMSFVDFQRAKLVCSNWYLASKHRVMKKKGSPWLILFSENKSNCELYNPEANEIYKPFIDYSGFRFLANSGKWFLVLTPEYNLCIIDLFTSERIDLPPLQSLVPFDNYTLRRVGDKVFQFVPRGSEPVYFTYDIDTMRGLLWVDEKNKANYAVIWYFYSPGIICLAFCKNGYDKYVSMPIYELLWRIFLRSRLLQLRGYKLYIHAADTGFAIVDLSDETFPYITQYKNSLLQPNQWHRPTRHLTVTSSGEVLVVIGKIRYSDDSPKILKFKVYKDDLDYEVESLGSDDEALLIDLGITTSVKDVPGIQPNSIYNVLRSEEHKLDICVFNLAKWNG